MPRPTLALPLLALVGCVMTPERFAERYEREVAQVIELCEGPSAPDADVEGPWSGDVVCEDFDPGAARACLTAYRGLREVDCVDPEGQPGAHRVPSACDLEAVCGAAAAADTDGL